MEKFEIYNYENCYICNELMGELKSDLTDVIGYSEKPIYQILESFSSVTLSDDIINESGVCQNCFIKFNEYDEHLTKAEQIQNELIGLMDNKLYGLEEVQESIIKQEELDIEDAEEIDTENSIEYAPYETETEEIFVTNNEGYLATESNPKNFYFGISNEDVKENKKLTGETLVKSRATRKTLEYPVVLMDNQKMYQCDICSRAFKEKSKLRTHREIHTTERNVFCPECGKSFKTQACLRSHKRVHNPIYMFCDYCGKCYTQKPELAKHIKFVHFKIREFFCETCGAGFGSKGHLSTHKLTHQDQSAKTVVCSLCMMAFHTRAKLDRHMKSHTKERNFECGICNKKFLYSYNVTAHIRHVHYRQKRKGTDSSCSFCGKKFHRKWKLSEHMAEVHQVIEAIIKDDVSE